jgi:ribosome biogenesis protein MAK21
MFFH